MEVMAEIDTRPLLTEGTDDQMKNTPAASAPRERGEIPDQLKWDPTGVYADWNAWENDYAAVADALDRL